MYVQFVHSPLGNEGVRVQLVYEGTCYLAWGMIFDRRRNRGFVCVFPVGVCVCIRPHTHTAGYSDVSPEVRMRHMKDPKNPDGLNLGICV